MKVAVSLMMALIISRLLGLHAIQVEDRDSIAVAISTDGELKLPCTSGYAVDRLIYENGRYAWVCKPDSDGDGMPNENDSYPDHPYYWGASNYADSYRR